ncbi:MAG: hypothetical protein ACT4P0_05750 [Panacagrimonas sp.]
MSDWDFLHDMHHDGYSPEQIADAAACGYNPWEEHISGEWIDAQLDDEPEVDVTSVQLSGAFQSRDGFPFSVLDQTQIFLDLVDCAARHFENTGRYLQIWGELGEIYAEIKFGLRRHGTHTAGSDGTIAGRLVEVKTISPEKCCDRVLVKSQGNFEQLLVVRIGRDFKFQARLFERSELKRVGAKFLTGQLSNTTGDESER